MERGANRANHCRASAASKVRCCRSCMRCRRSSATLTGRREPLIAEALNISRAEVHGVVTFYHDFRASRAGRHVLKLCRAEPARRWAAMRLPRAREARLGIAFRRDTTADGRVTLEPIYCLGLCAVRPSAMLDGKHRRPARRQKARRTPRGDRPMSALRIYVPRDAACRRVRRRRGRCRDRRGGRQTQARRSRSCAPARAACSGSSR